jgi:probable F420-dependent oxidoreductase
MHQFRFGVMVNDSAALPRGGAEWAEYCRRLEQQGFSSVLLSDHLWRQLAPVPAIMAAADATSTLHIGSLMFANDYRHPAILAKELATIDLLSDGRLEVGIGAGWKLIDYAQAGITQDPAGVRVDRLAESVQVLKGLWAGDSYSYAGEHYTITDLEGTPVPIQRPHPPLIIGGGGKRVLSLAGREADIVGINRSLKQGKVSADAKNNSSADSTDQKVGWIRDAAGDRFAQLELNMVIPDVVITDDRGAAAARLADSYLLEPSQVLEVPQLWCGTVDQICEDLVRRRERWGVSYLVVVAKHAEAALPVVERLAGR